jgi:hypothetical protein
LSTVLHDAGRSTDALRLVDNTDWLKTAAIILACVDHFGHFFADDDRWWAVFGRLAAPAFFFLMGYAHTRRVPLHWIWLGMILTLLNSWNAGWAWVAPNILLSLALIRLARPHMEALVQRHGWNALALLVGAFVVLLPIAANIVDYGTEGWLWALFGLCQRRWVDRISAARDSTGGLSTEAKSIAQPVRSRENAMRLFTCLVAALVYVWQEQKEFGFPRVHLMVLVVTVAALTLALCLFRRGVSSIQPPQLMTAPLSFIGRHTLEIYALQLAGSELIVKLLPELAA